jgi:hypothetical protein
MVFELVAVRIFTGTAKHLPETLARGEAVIDFERQPR